MKSVNPKEKFCHRCKNTFQMKNTEYAEATEATKATEENICNSCEMDEIVEIMVANMERASLVLEGFKDIPELCEPSKYCCYSTDIY